MSEYWDLYDGRRQPLGRTHPRGRALVYGEYHIVVFAWVVDPAGRVLMTRRAPEKSYGGYWECTGGCVFAGETSDEAARRELREETGVDTAPGELLLVRALRRVDDFADIYIVTRRAADVRPRTQDGETDRARWLTLAEYDALLAEGRVVPSAQGLRGLSYPAFTME